MAIELIQHEVGRTAELIDVVRNLLGFTLGYYIKDKKIIIIVIIIIVLERQYLLNFYDNRVLKSSYSTLYNNNMNQIENSYKCYNCSVNINNYFNVEYSDRLFSGLIIRNFKEDWSKYKYLKVKVDNIKEEGLVFLFFVSNNDKKYISIDTNGNEYKIDMSMLNANEIDISKMKRFGVFKGSGVKSGFNIILTEIKLIE